MFEKPNSTTVKDLLIENVAFDTGFPLEVVEKVVKFQGEDLVEGLRNNSQVEISGFGILYVAKTKLKNTTASIERLLQGELSPSRRELTNKVLKYLKEKKCRS